MQIAVSVIAWNPDEDEHALHMVHEAGIKNVEVVPSRMWLVNDDGTFHKKESFLKLLQNEKLTPVAMQGLLYERPDLSIFGTKNQLEETKSYFNKIIDAASSAGIKKLVFGSPKNKLRLQRTKDEANKESFLFFEHVGKLSYEKGITFCIEPTPSVYGGDYLSTTREVVSLLKQIKIPGISLNLDIGAILTNNEDIESIIKLSSPFIGHVHISMPELERVTTDIELHNTVASALRNQGYEGFISVEMKAVGENNTNDLPTILEVILKFYG